MARLKRHTVVQNWMARRGWKPFAFQREVWAAVAQGRSGLLHATTGSGKTYAVWLGMLAELLARYGTPASAAPARAPALSLLWITPMRALAADTTRALREPLNELAPGWTLGMRSGDTPSAERARQDRRMPTVLVTTPESLSLMLSRENARTELGQVTHVVCDEWHELIGSKRGVQVQLALARLRRFQPALVTWGLSATLGNLAEAMEVLCGPGAALVQGRVDKTLVIDTLIPPDPGRYSWAGHLGARMQDPVVAEIERSGTTLVFTNVRSQAEIWYQLLLERRPEWAGQIALHHGSLDKAVREWVEQGLKAGTLRAVVATSSLDLGVDFLPVERVLADRLGQGRGAAAAARWPQRACAGAAQPHHPGAHQHAGADRGGRRSPRRAGRAHRAAQLARAAAGRAGAASGHAGAGRWLLARCRLCRGLQRLRLPAPQPCCIRLGAGLLRAGWPQPDGLSRLPPHRARDEAGIYRVPDRAIARRHRMAIGTITSDASMQVKYLSGGASASMEEGFIARLRKGDCFVFAGRLLELVRVQDMVAYVKKRHQGASGTVAVWNGSKMPLSSEMGAGGAGVDAGGRAGHFDGPELQAPRRPMLETQRSCRACRPPHAAGGAVPIARRLAPVRAPVCRPPCAPGAGQPAGLAAVAGPAQHLQPVGQ
jgi:ATP-dependent Lhr-like helicase